VQLGAQRNDTKQALDICCRAEKLFSKFFGFGAKSKKSLGAGERSRNQAVMENP
jgi:hypothetical protein